MHTRTHRRDSRMRTRSGARARRDMFVCAAPPLERRPEHRIDRLTPIRPQMGRLLEHGVSANGLTRCMHARLPRPGASVPTAEPSRCMHTAPADTRTTVTMMTLDKTMVDALASYTGTVMRCPPGRASAPDVKERGQAQFQCVCGHAGTMPYPTLFKRLWRGQRRRKPLRLRCQRCGRVLR
jgi:hypothetical protein